MNSKCLDRPVVAPGVATTSLATGAMQAASSTNASSFNQGAALLQPLIDAAFPETGDPLCRLRRRFASWLASSPFPVLGPYHALLTSAGQVLRFEPTLLQNPGALLQKLRVLLLSPENRGIFAISTADGKEVVCLDELALRRFVNDSSSASGGPGLLTLPSSPWDAAMDAALQLGIPRASGEGLQVSLSSDSSLTAAASLMTNSSVPLTSGQGSCSLTGVQSVGLEGGDQLDSLTQPVLAAIAAAWPGTGALARLKRRAALALAAAQDGPEGPYSMLASALGDVLHRHEPDAVAELRHPVTKTLRVKQLLHEGGHIGDAAMPLPGLGSSGNLNSSVNAAGATANVATEGAGFLRVVKGKYDIVVVLDLPALMQVYGKCGPATGAALPTQLQQLAAPSHALRQVSLCANSASTAAEGPAHTDIQTSLLGKSPGDGSISGEAGMASQTALSQGSGGAAAGGSGVIEGVSELALRAFPGSAPAAQLRRAIVVHLAGLPRRSQQWTHLGIFVASSQAHLWLNPSNRWPKLKAFVMHPDSRGVFLDVQMPGPGAAAGLVALDPTALRRAAAAGLATAINAAWPGHAPLERIRRAAAFTLAFAARGPAGPYTMLGSALGTAIRKRDKEAFDALAGMGKLSELLDDTSVGGAGGGAPWEAGGGGGGGPGVSGPGGGGTSEADAATNPSPPGSGGGAAGGTGGYIVSFKKDQDGFFRLRLEVLLQDWPREDPATGASGSRVPGSGSDPGSDLASFAPSTPAAFAVGPAFSTVSAASLSLLSGAAAHSAAGSASGDVSSPPLEQELLRRFPPPQGTLANSEQATIAAAKRCIARLLAWAPPPHQLTFAKLGAQVPKLLGGARIGRNLRLVCLEEPDVFAVQSQSPTVHVVRLICPRLLQMAQEQSERKGPTMLQPPQQALPPVMQMYAQKHPGSVQQQLNNMLQLQAHNPALSPQLQLPPGVAVAARAPALIHPAAQLRLQPPSQRLLLQPRADQDVTGFQQHIQLLGASSADPGRQAAAANAGWAAPWQLSQPPQQQLRQHASQEQQLLLLQQQQGIPPQQHNLTSGAGGGVPPRLFDDRISIHSSASVASLSGVGGPGADGFSAHPIDSGPVSWHRNSGGGSRSLAQQQQEQIAAAAAAAGPTAGGVPQRIQDFAASALVAEQALQPQGSSGSPILPHTAVHVLADPYSSDFLAVLQHCHACPQIGLAVQVYDGRPALVSLYAPSAMAMAPADGAVGGLPEAWSPAVYVLDCTASSAGEGPEALVAALLANLRSLLEEPGVAKVVHGCEQIRALEVASGATIAPLLDTRVLLDAVSTLLPPLPPLPSVAAVAAAAAAGPLPVRGYSSAEAAAMAQLSAHIGGLRVALQSVELWSDRPEMVAVLSELHFAAHRAELWAAAGRDSTWLSRPLTESQVAVAAQAVHHLPELWAALCEAVPWLAAHAALRLMQHLRAVPVGLGGQGQG
ncbi:hypothetical protein Agub_g15267 [Astrephomene gubernaculifera]|uniref:Uncharacterized protein n=1 Tax=Astrephomene gubernaculifera TaxID=47775 RepID=A0AAD3HU55_9CHLO|nr:hypothetical protein Agub_g15267 [Astrephomene gubernaculifera]